ncbi:MAG: DNA-formamidopyrimidine glycosylase family protein [Pirellulales bacterium]
MPELPDVVNYVHKLDQLLRGQEIRQLLIRSPFVLRTFSPDVEIVAGRIIEQFSRRGKRIVLHLQGDIFLVFHLMIAGRFHWFKGEKKPTGKNDLLSIVTDIGTMKLTEASSKKRAGLWLFESLEQVNQTDPGGINVLQCSLVEFREQLLKENRTLKRCLTEPRKFDGIGNAYSDEILHCARLSPLKRTQLTEEEILVAIQLRRDVLNSEVKRLASEQNQGAFQNESLYFMTRWLLMANSASPVQFASPIQPHRLRRKRMQLLPRLPNWWQDFGRSKCRRDC